MSTTKPQASAITRQPYRAEAPDGRTIVDRHGATVGFVDDADIGSMVVAALNAFDPETAIETGRYPAAYRVGRSLGRTVYRQVGREASKDDVVIGMMDTRLDAMLVVAALNSYQPAGQQRWQVQARRTIEGTVTVEATSTAEAVRAAEAMSHEEFMDLVEITADEVHTGVAQPVD